MRTLLLVLLSAVLLNAANILVVDDDNRYNNETKVYDALMNSDIEFDTFVCDTTSSSPTSTEMGLYDLVIWFSGDDYSSLYFWEGKDTVNTEIEDYLDNGGKLWVWGMDIFYDYYGGAADTFQVGDFAYDYLGISSYDSQSSQNGSTGGVTLLPQVSSGLSGLDTLIFYKAVNYVDGCTPVTGATSYYKMGPDSYELAGQSVVQSYETDMFKVLTSFFNPYYFDETADRDIFVEEVVNWFLEPTPQILVVDDDNRYNNETKLYAALENANLRYDSFDTDAAAASPTADFMANYELVIWFSGDDGFDTYFWNGNDTENAEIKALIDGGANFWVYGGDILYDMYGSAADTFQVGDFVYDYLGISSYDSQSSLNGSTEGVWTLPQANAGLSTLDTLHMYKAVKYFDGCTPVPSGISYYKLGSDDYELTSQSIVQGFEKGDSQILTSWFNPYYFSNATTDRDDFVADVVSWFFQDNMSPIAFSTVSPEADSLLIINSETDVFDFTWNYSSDPEGGSVEYILYLENSTTNEILFQSNTVFNYATVLGSDLLDIITDTTDVNWYVMASDGVSKTSSDTVAIKIGSAGNLAPEDFMVLEPAFNQGIRLIDIPTEGLTFTWEASTDANKDTVKYSLYLNIDTTMVISATDLLDPEFTFTKAVFETILGDSGFVSLDWYVTASDTEFTTFSDTSLLHLSTQTVNLLLVDDDNRYNNETYLYNAILANQVVTDVFDCDAEGASPTATLMSGYDFVMWFAGDDGVGLQFWAGSDTVNTEIEDYLDGGGRMWIWGMDVLYDRYGSASDDFVPGDFIYDYFGTARYKMQSYGNDGGLGVPMLERTANTTMTELETITWGSRDILKWVDGCDITANSYADLVYGDETYPYAGIPVSYHTLGDDFITMSTWFNAYYMDNDSVRSEFVGDVLNWFMNNSTIATLDMAVISTPAADSEILLDAAETEFTFSWSAVTSIDSILYQVEFSTDAEGITPLVVPTTETSLTVTADELFPLTGNGSDTLSLSWTVFAITPEAALSASLPRNHTLIEAINESPSLFVLWEPANNDTINVVDDMASVSFSWSPSFDPDADTVYYELILAAMGDTLLSITTTDTSVSVSGAELNDAMAGATSLISGWKVVASDGEFEVETLTNILHLSNNWVSIDEQVLPEEFALYNNYPNPFNPNTTISFAVPELMDVTIQIYDIRGRLCNTLLEKSMDAGYHKINWNASRYSSGLYFVKISGNKKVFTQKVTLLK